MERKLFNICMNSIRQQDDLITEFETTINRHSTGFCIFEPTPVEFALFTVLKEQLHDEHDLISWYLYEDVEKVIYYENKPYFYIDDDDDLYDFLTILQDEFDPAFPFAEKLAESDDDLEIMKKYNEICNIAEEYDKKDTDYMNHKEFNLAQIYKYIKKTMKEN